MVTEKLESKRLGLIKALVLSIMAFVVYAVVFTHSRLVLDIVFSRQLQAPALVITVVLLASGLYGTASNKFFKHTLEKKLQSQQMREE